MPLSTIVFTVECGNRLRVGVRAKDQKLAEYGFGVHPLAQNQYMQENISGN